MKTSLGRAYFGSSLYQLFGDLVQTSSDTTGALVWKYLWSSNNIPELQKTDENSTIFWGSSSWIRTKYFPFKHLSLFLININSEAVQLNRRLYRNYKLTHQDDKLIEATIGQFISCIQWWPSVEDVCQTLYILGVCSWKWIKSQLTQNTITLENKTTWRQKKETVPKYCSPSKNLSISVSTLNIPLKV